MNRRLIDATECVKDLQFMRGADKKAYWQSACDYLINKIDAMKSVDAVEVVRCKDCVWFGKVRELDACNRIYGFPIAPIKSNDYCSYGRRKENT